MTMGAIEELRGRVFPVLDKGHVVLMDAMGDDRAICDAARRSYGKGTRKVSEDRDLIRYMMRHQHMTPFEMCEIKLALKVPNGDTWRQMIRHRAAPIWDDSSMFDEPSINAYSYRYSEAVEEFQSTPPDGWRLQDPGNKQGSRGTLCRDDGPGPPGRTGDGLTWCESMFHEEAIRVYRERLDAGVAREQARKDLPNSLYTEAYWKCDLRNVLHFLGLRMNSHAQHEIRQYANIIGNEIVAKLFPLTWVAFCDYHLDAMTLSRLDVEATRLAAVGDNLDVILAGFANKREREECRDKLIRLGLIAGGPPP